MNDVCGVSYVYFKENRTKAATTTTTPSRKSTCAFAVGRAKRRHKQIANVALLF